jgi:hypothetical protein
MGKKGKDGYVKYVNNEKKEVGDQSALPHDPIPSSPLRSDQFRNFYRLTAFEPRADAHSSDVQPLQNL